MNVKVHAPLAVLILLIASCGQAPTTAPIAQPRSTSTPGTAPQAGPLFAVVEGSDTVAIVGLDGYARTNAKFPPRQQPYAGGSAIEQSYVPLQGVAQVAGSGVYFIDGYGTVRVLRVGAQSQVVAMFPQQPVQYETWFAVSPDGSSVVAGVLQFPAVGPTPSGGTAPGLVGPWKFNYATAPAGGPTTVLRHFEGPVVPDGATTFPVGWTAVGPVAMVPLTIWTQTGWSGGPLYGVDPAGVLSTRLGGADCYSASITRGGLIPCVGAAVRDATGNVIWAPKQMGGVDARKLHISPDGQAIADGASASPTHASTVETRAGGLVQLPQGFSVQGWLDANTMMGRVVQQSGDMGNLSWVSLGDPTKLHDLGFKGDFVATLAAAG